ncbi:hypothetical protein [Spartinivicinus ruber]|uniref:hypothetical protein n=1 Tax=Spartinivicinus ruber TaxID=2683272 RepID=UPI0013D1B8A0|nr:hypothetical protein [Spartinivicinus ruber]
MTRGKHDVIQLYKKYYLDRENEQINLFKLLKQELSILNAIYPGSYVHISPAFIYPQVVFIDSDKNAIKFFKEEDRVIDIISSRKEYDATPSISFYGRDYNNPIEELLGGFDLLISQYAGFISSPCKQYLKVGGYLLANDSHGDAGLASIDNDYKLVAAINESNEEYKLSFKDLAKYFIPKKDITVTNEHLYKTGKGISYTNTAPLYIFQRLS